MRLARLRRALRAASGPVLATVLAAAQAMAPAAPAAPSAAPTGLLDWTDEERAAIAQHGPWPLPPRLDPGNALAGRPAAVALGQALFFDARLSPDGRLACASCHQPQRAFADGRPRALGRAGPGQPVDTPLARHAPSLWNAGQQRWLGWDGAFDSLWSQALHPLLAPQEMASAAPQLRRLLAQDASLACRWRQAQGSAPPADDTALLVGLAKALGAFVGSLQSAPTSFDAFREALSRGDLAAAQAYPLAAQRGLRLFVGRGQCALCHTGPLFSSGEFGDVGALFFVRPGVVDPGRLVGIQALQASPFNLLGHWADAAPGGAAGLAEAATTTAHVQAQQRNFGEFKVPSLRNVAATPPYFHDGQKATLAEVIRHYDRMDPDRVHSDGEQILRPLRLSPDEAADLLAFLHTLDDHGASRWQPPRLPPCPPPAPRRSR